MNNTNETKALKKQLMAAIAMVMVAAVALTSATYAWFVNNSKVTATGGDYKAETADYLLISKTGAVNTFGTTIALGEALTNMKCVSTADATFGKFYQVDQADTGAWANNNAQKFKAATEGTEYFTSDFWLKSTVASQQVYMDITDIAETVAEGKMPIKESVYVGFGKVSEDAVNMVKIYQIDNGKSQTVYNTGSDFTAETGVYSTKGITSIDSSTKAATAGDLTVANGTTFGLTNQVFDTMSSTAETATQYRVFVWIEGTDAQAYNPAASEQVTFNLAFKTITE
ncbi:MAG: hypothetical protein PHW34_03515 [Hespellia sp.]|nr:hypothetical protein [Hespellia sp.]